MTYRIVNDEGTPTPKRFRVVEDKPKNNQGLLRQFANAASFGFDDELTGAVSAITGGDYASARDAYRRERQEYGEEHPVQSFVAGLAGGLTTGIAGAGKFAATKIGKAIIDAYKKTGAAVRLGANVGTGAVTGGLSGLGNADSSNRIKGAISGGVIGGATGGMVQPVAYVARKAADIVTPAARWAKDKATMSPTDQFARKLAQQAERDGLTAEQVSARLKKLGPNAMLADVSDNIRGLAESYAILPGEAKRAANTALLSRAKGQASRVTSSLMDSLDAPDLNFDQHIQNIHANMREVGKGYAPILDSKEVPITPQLQRLLEGPYTKAALAKARMAAMQDYANGETEFIAQKYFKIDKEGSVSLKSSSELSKMMDDILDQGGGQPGDATYEKLLAASRELNKARKATGDNSLRAEIIEPPVTSEGMRPTLRVWDYVKRGFDELIAEGTDPINGKLTPTARRALVSKKILLDSINDPDYKKLRNDFADEAAMESALKLGRGFFNKDSEVTLRHMADMSEPEKNMFRAGAARAARDKILSAPDTGNAYKRVFGNQLTRDKLRAIFPDAKSFTKFARSIEREAKFSQTKNAILGNSRTAAREALKDDSGIDPSVVLDFAQGRVGALAAKLASSRLQSAMEVPEAVRNAGAQYLFSTDPAVKAKGLQLLTNQAGLLGSRRALPQPSPLVPLTAGLLGMQVDQ